MGGWSVLCLLTGVGHYGRLVSQRISWATQPLTASSVDSVRCLLFQTHCVWFILSLFHFVVDMHLSWWASPAFVLRLIILLCATAYGSVLHFPFISFKSYSSSVSKSRGSLKLDLHFKSGRPIIKSKPSCSFELWLCVVFRGSARCACERLEMP